MKNKYGKEFIESLFLTPAQVDEILDYMSYTIEELEAIGPLSEESIRAKRFKQAQEDNNEQK